jgi:hypothetical protein
MDGVPWMPPIDSFLTGALVLGPPDMGKSRFVVRLFTEIKRADPSVRITIIDPKAGFTEYAGLLNAIPIDGNKCSFSINKLAGIEYRNMVLELMPPLSDTAGLIYGTEVVNESALIALERLDEYIKSAGTDGELSFKDIYSYLPFVEGAKSGRRSGYREAAQTAIRRLMGENDLFACRKGLDLKWLFENDVIISTRSLTDDMQCRALTLLLLYTKYQQCRYLPQTSRLRHLIIIDDGSQYVGNVPHQQNTNFITTAYAHILTKLRSSGTGVCCVTHLPAHMNNAFLALLRTMIVIGSMAGDEHLKVITNFMRLNEDQATAVTRLSKREAIVFAPNTEYKGILHGWVPQVPDPPIDAVIPQAPDLGIVPWQHLEDIPSQPSVPEKRPGKSPEAAKKSNAGQLPQLSEFNDNTKKLLWDCTTYLFNITTTRIKRLCMTGRNFEAAKEEAVNAGMLIESCAGRPLFLIPTVKLFEAFGIIPPYARNVSIEHSFYTLLFEHILKSDTSVRKTQIEFPVGQTGSTGDISTITQSGVMNAYEVTLNTSNIMSQAVKYKDSAYSKITFLCRTSQLAKAVEQYFKNHSLEVQIASRLEVTHFSQIFKNYRKNVNL